MDETRMTDDDFRQFVMRTLAEHDSRHAEHEARMARMDQQYEKLLEVQLDLARSHDEHEGRMAGLQRLQRSLHRTEELQAEMLDQMRLTLDAIKEILRERRN